MTTAQAAPGGLSEPRAREYETIYILRSDIAPEDASRLAARAREIIEGMGGLVLKIDNWGRRRLAYPINKATRGVFVFLNYVGRGGLVAELERNLRLLDAVIRYQTVVAKAPVRIEDYQVDPTDLEFRELEVVEEEPEPELAQRLGLVERPRNVSTDDMEGGDDVATGADDGRSAAGGDDYEGESGGEAETKTEVEAGEDKE